MRTIDEIIVHCTANRADSPITMADIRRHHVMINGWRDVGYHFVVFPDGRVEAGRPVSSVGSHCRGHNARSIGIAYVGGLDANGKPADTRTDNQKLSIVNLIRYLRSIYPIKAVHGHRFYCKFKACPCFDVEQEYQKL